MDGVAGCVVEEAVVGEMRDGGRASKSWCYDIVNGDGKAAKFQLAGERNPSLRVCAEPKTAGARAASSPRRENRGCRGMRPIRGLGG